MNVVDWWWDEAICRASTDEPRSVPLPDDDVIVAELGTLEAQALFGFARRLGLTDDLADDAVPGGRRRSSPVLIETATGSSAQ